MFTPPRFVVIDDDIKHLHAIADAVQVLGSVCARVHYQLETDVPVEPFRGVRVIFMDLQLQDRAMTSDFNRHFAEIQRILSKVINPRGGPYLLVLWTDRPERATELSEYLESFFTGTPHTRPVALVALSKMDHIDLATGELIGDGGGLRDAIISKLAESPAAAALVQWENDVLDASARVLADLMELSSDAGPVPEALATLLKRLATEAVGQVNADADKKSSVDAALLPLLQDHMQNAAIDGSAETVWSKAFEGAPGSLPQLRKPQVARLNTMMHVTLPSGHHPIAPTSWGAICEIEDSIDWREFGYDSAETCAEAVRKSVKIDWPKYKDKSRLLQVRIGAACDYAQKADGPIPYALALALPERVEVKPHGLAENSTAWISPALVLGALGVVQLLVDPRFVRVRGAEQTGSFTVVGRVKEQLLLELVSAVSMHGARPGIVRFKAQ